MHRTQAPEQEAMRAWAELTVREQVEGPHPTGVVLRPPEEFSDEYAPRGPELRRRARTRSGRHRRTAVRILLRVAALPHRGGVLRSHLIVSNDQMAKEARTVLKGVTDSWFSRRPGS